MGEIVLAAKIAHVPTMLLSQQFGKMFGCKQQAIGGLKERVKRAIEAGVDTIIVLGTFNWLTSSYDNHYQQ